MPGGPTGTVSPLTRAIISPFATLAGGVTQLIAAAAGRPDTGAGWPGGWGKGMHLSDSAWDRQVREGESGAQRADRNFADLLQELRITLTGSQILFAFLLVVPFSGGFHQVSGFQRALYVAVLLTSALSAGLLVAPAAIHRVVFRQHLKAALVQIAGALALAGQSLFMIALAEAILLVVGYLYNLAVGAGLAALLLAWYATWFFVVPVVLRRRSAHGAGPGPPSPGEAPRNE
jgi:hypothetical protein